MPIEEAEKARNAAVENDIDLVVCIGGGSTTGLANGDLNIASGLNALAHCIDSMWAPRADPINQALAGEGIRALNRGLPAIRRNPDDLEGRELALYGAYLSAVAFASAGSGMHHKICHVLGGRWNMPHAQTDATVLPYVLAFNAPPRPTPPTGSPRSSEPTAPWRG